VYVLCTCVVYMCCVCVVYMCCACVSRVAPLALSKERERMERLKKQMVRLKKKMTCNLFFLSGTARGHLSIAVCAFHSLIFASC